MHGDPPIEAIVLLQVWPFSVTMTGARTFPKTALGRSHRDEAIEPSRTIVVENVLGSSRATPWAGKCPRRRVGC